MWCIIPSCAYHEQKKSFEIGVNAEWLKEQQHQIKYETILFLQWKTCSIDYLMQLNNCSEWALCSVWMLPLFVWCIILNANRRTKTGDLGTRLCEWKWNAVSCDLYRLLVTKTILVRLTGMQVTHTYHSEYTAWQHSTVTVECKNSSTACKLMFTMYSLLPNTWEGAQGLSSN